MASTVGRIGTVTNSAANRRRAQRVAVAAGRASVRRISEQPAEATLGDLSIYGCRITSPLEHQAGERIWLRFTGANPIPATIVWCDNGVAGCRFDEQIANTLFRALTLDEQQQSRCVGITGAGSA